MGWSTYLGGTIRISKAAFERLIAIRGLDWRWGDDSIVDYLKGEVDYDEERRALSFSATHKMTHHREFFDVLAATKDVDTVDEVEQIGETTDAWHETGRFFVKPGAWAYVGEGRLVSPGSEDRGFDVVGPERATLDHVRAWREAPPLVRAVAWQDEILVVERLDGRSGRVSTKGLPALAELVTREAATRARVVRGGLEIAWMGDDGRELFRLGSSELWNACAEVV